jgi:hypothetical protein
MLGLTGPYRFAIKDFSSLDSANLDDLAKDILQNKKSEFIDRYLPAIPKLFRKNVAPEEQVRKIGINFPIFENIY